MSWEIDYKLFKAPFTAMIAGPTQSGKTTLLLEILKNVDKYVYPRPDRIVYCYSRPQSSIRELQNVEKNEGLPDLDQFDAKINNLIILDDLMSECESSKEIVNLFTVDSHHKNISTFILAQNLYSRGKYARTISLNCNYLVIFNNPRDRSQIQFLSRQMYPTNSSFLIECYEDATETKHGYLFLDLTQAQDNNFRVQSNILDENRIIYVSKKK